MPLFLPRRNAGLSNSAWRDSRQCRSAGTTDSALTNHGALQANRLGRHLADAGIRISHIFSSDLQRAFKTAEAIRLAQSKYLAGGVPIARETRQIALLRELDFGSYEGKPITKPAHEPFMKGKEVYSETHKNNHSKKDVESNEAMRARAERFVTEYLVSLLIRASGECSVVIVSHGIFLTHLWRCILNHFPARNVSIAPDLGLAERGLTLEFPGGWSNTGYLELELRRRASGVQTGIAPPTGTVIKSPLRPSLGASKIETSVLLGMSLHVKAVDCLKHLHGLKRTGGGIGSAKHDEAQKTIESFFKRRKVD